MKITIPIYRLKRLAKQLSKEESLPLTVALDIIANGEGFGTWSSLAHQHGKRRPAAKLLASLNNGDLVLLGARPGHGKTMLGLELSVEAANAGIHGAFYSLDFTQNDIAIRLEALGFDVTDQADGLTLDTSNEICADYILSKMSSVLPGAVIVIDYLQLLDQNRSKPIVTDQILALKSFANAKEVIVVLISQIDRAYDPITKPLPDALDVRMPNPIDLKLFDKMIFINDGQLNLQTAA